MPRRYFNWKLAIVLVISIGVLGVTAFGLRQWQRTNRAEQGLVLGNKAYDEQKWEQAVANLGRHLTVEPDDVPTLLKYAEAQLKIRPSKRNNIQQAISAYRTVLRADKNNSEAAMRLTEVYLMMGMPGEAELIANRQLETNDDPELRRILALALARQRKFSEAAAQLKSILQEHPDQILVYETLGQLIEQRPDDFPDSNDWFNEAVKNNPSSALAYIVRAGFHRRAKDSTKALSDLEQAEKQDLSDPNVELRLASEFIYANNLDKAEQHLTAVQTTSPTDQGLWQTWAQLALKSQSQEKMLKVAETGLKELSSQPWDFMPIATELFIRCDQLDRAADCITKMNQKDVAPVTVAFLEGLVAAEREHLFEAIKHWQQSMALADKSSEVHAKVRLNVQLALSKALSRLGNTQLALRHLRTLVSERPNLFSGHLALAKLSAQTGNWTDAAEHAETAKRLSPENTGAALLYIQARIQLLAAGSTGENDQMWQDIEKDLSALLEKASNGALEVKLLQYQLALRQSNFANAQALVTQLKKDHPLQIRIAMAEAELLIAQDKMNEAISMLNKTMEEFPQNVEPVRYIAILLNRQGNQEKCEAIIKDALARIDQPVNQRTLGLLLAEFYSLWNQKDDAYPTLSALAEKLPDDIPVKRRLLLCEQVIKDPEKAQQLVNDIKLLEGEDGWQWRHEQAKLWFAADDFKVRYPQIVSLLQENMRANSNDQASRMLLAAAYDRSGELRLAISTYREALSRSPDDLRIIMPTVAALYKANKPEEYDEADQLLSRVSQQKHPQLQQLQLQSYLRHGELSLASDILQDFISNDPNNQANRLSLALLKTQQAKFDEAGELLDELKAKSPNSLPITYAQIQLNIRQNKSAEALKLCDEIINNLDNAYAYVLRARTYDSLGQADKALRDFEHAAAIEPNNVSVWMARSDFYLSMGQTDKAIADIQQALSLGLSDIQIQKRAILLLFESGDAEKIRQGKVLIDEALQSNPDDVDLRLFKAKSLLTEGMAPAIKNATRILQKITEDQPEISQAWALLGKISFSQKQFSKAMDAALRGLAHTPNDRTLLLLKAGAEAKRSPVLAIPTLKMLRELDPNNTDAAMFLANTYITTKEPRKAVNILKAQLVSRAGTQDERRIKVALAVALHKNGNKADAQKEFDSLIQSEPNDPVPLLAQVRLLKDDQLWSELSQKVTDWYQKHPEDSRTPIIIARNLVTTDNSQAKKTAEDILRIMLKNDSDSIETMTALAILLYTIGRSDESVPLYQRTLQLKPDNLIIINNLAWIMCEEQGNFQEALELAQRGLQISPNYIDLIDTRGVAYYRLGEFNKAVEDFTTCIKLYPDGTPAAISARFHLARAFDKLGQKDKAVKRLNQALDMYQALDPADRIGALSDTDLDEAQRLLKQLQEDG
ncbi:MAG: tetratricopeptide repeat protein [Planctomycetes bacterium]|nr:tetratricopeptide repeat protein [Planctomycetota bacterium]MCH8118231.1 tetratricopeptide repeat protein [Planctomycetota bacterium]